MVVAGPLLSSTCLGVLVLIRNCREILSFTFQAPPFVNFRRCGLTKMRTYLLLLVYVGLSLSKTIPKKDQDDDPFTLSFGPSGGGTSGSGSSGAGCVYKGQTYSQGQTWRDGCSYNCQCTDGSTGRYQCTSLCPQYQNLPSQCTLVKDPTNTCCSKPQCNFQTSGGSTSGSGTMSGTMTGTGTSGSCTNSLSNCDQYDKSVCTNSNYAQWVKNNCCAYCQSVTGSGSGGTSGSGGDPFQLVIVTNAPGTQAPPLASGSGTGSCADTIANCAAYTKATCTDPNYAKWVTDHCAKYCNKCSTSGTGSNTCQDKLSNCAQYTQATCTNPDYAQWVSENCAKYCNKCGGSSGTGTSMTGTGTSGTGMTGTGTSGTGMTGTGTSGTGMTGTGTSGTGMTGTGTGGSSSGSFTFTSCMDKNSQCAQMATQQHICTDASAKIYAQAYCAKTCNFCSGSGTGTGTSTGTGTMTGGTTTCKDNLPNCSAYTTSICSNTQYATWVSNNCAAYCNKCSGSGTMTGTGSSTGTGTMTGTSTGTGTMTGTGTGTMTGTGTGTGGTITGQSSGCVYKGNVYQQGQTWKDACQYSCTCKNAATGMYECNSLCMNWNLPSACHMNPPAAGKCCPTPSCPSGYNIQYPPGYVAN